MVQCCSLWDRSTAYRNTVCLMATAPIARVRLIISWLMSGSTRPKPVNMLRLFIAIDLPEPIKLRLADLCSGLPDAKWVKHEQMHLTLHFIGDVNESGFGAVKSAL